MTFPRKTIALMTGAIFALSASFISTIQAQQPSEGGSPVETFMVDKATFKFIDKSKVSALTEGVLEKLEVRIGAPVRKDDEIGFLHKKKAELLVRKAKTAATSEGPLRKAEAQKDQAITVVARNDRLRKANKTYVSQEDYEKALADLSVTLAMIQEAKENRTLAEDDLHLAQEALDEHTIKAPFDGVVFNVMKSPGEAVKANEPVIELGNLDKLQVFVFVPLETSLRISEGAEVEWQLTIDGKHVDQKKYRGVISFVDPQVQLNRSLNQGEVTEVRIYADFKNEGHFLQPGMKGVLTFFLNPPGTKPVRRTYVPKPDVAAPATEAPAVAASPGPPPATPPLSPDASPNASNLPQLPPR